MSENRQYPVAFSQTWRIVWRHLTARRKRQLAVLAVLAVLATFAELVSIAVILPFLAVLAAPEQLFANATAAAVLEFLGYTDPAGLVFPLTALFLVTALVSGGLRLAMTWAQSRLSHAIGADLAIEMFERTLFQPYRFHAASNSSRAITVLINKSVKLVSGLVLPTLQIIGAVALLVTIAIGLLIVAPVLALSIFGGIVVIYGAILLGFRGRIRRNGNIMIVEATRAMQVLQESLGGIRDVLLDGAQAFHVRRFRSSIRPLRAVTAENTFLAMAPRYIIETAGLIVFALVAYAIAQRPGGLVAALPVLGTIAIAAQRLLPVAQQCYSAWTNMRGSGPGIEECLTYLELPLGEKSAQLVAPIPFARQIAFENVGFAYEADLPQVLRGLDLTIPRGSRVGIIGATGSGKSTLADILMGLIAPTEGRLAIDGNPIDETTRPAWQRHIAHVPQAIFLADASVAENIAFGVPAEEIDHDLIRDAIERAQLSETIARLPHGAETTVGERGIRLSGGQRQRLGIARALYRRADVIVFDEATSALDGETELRVMQAIDALDDDLTIIMIAHRLSTLRNCDTIIELEKGIVIRSGPPASMFAKSA